VVNSCIIDGHVAALVGTVPETDFGEDPLKQHLEDLRWLESAARAHHEVIDTAFRMVPHPLRSPGLAGYEGWMIRDDSFLVDRDRIEDFLRGTRLRGTLPRHRGGAQLTLAAVLLRRRFRCLRSAPSGTARGHARHEAESAMTTGPDREEPPRRLDIDGEEVERAAWSASSC
jgi:hypothetical protein